jgi:hypothetical protein
MLSSLPAKAVKIVVIVVHAAMTNASVVLR